MNVTVINETGYVEAIFGLGLSYGLTSNHDPRNFIYTIQAEEKTDSVFESSIFELYTRLNRIALKLSKTNAAERKFLRMMHIYLYVEAPLYWWKQYDTYKVGTVAESESTMHTIVNKPFEIYNFEGALEYQGEAKETMGKILDTLNHMRLEILTNPDKKVEVFKQIITLLPESYIQGRLLDINYEVLQNIINQRHNHKLKEWHYFIEKVTSQIKYKQLLDIPK